MTDKMHTFLLQNLEWGKKQNAISLYQFLLNMLAPSPPPTQIPYALYEIIATQCCCSFAPCNSHISHNSMQKNITAKYFQLLSIHSPVFLHCASY